MKFNFKKIASVLAGTVMLSSTLAFAAAANYPAPFVQNGNADVAVVYGSAPGSTMDLLAVMDIVGNLGTKLAQQTATSGSGSSASVNGDAATLASGGDMIYLLTALDHNVETITNDALSNVLADGTFEDDSSNTYDYEQTIAMGSRNFTFSDSGNDLTDPALIIDVGTSTTSPLYSSIVTFTEAVNFTDADSKGQDITLFGKTYTVGSSTTSSVLQLLGAGKEIMLSSAENSQTVTLGEDTYTITVNGVNTAGTEASVTVNGETKSITEDTTKKVGGISIYAKDLMANVGDTWTATIQAGADELYLESGSAVQVGSDKTDIEGTKVTITGAFTATTKIQIDVTAADNDADHIAVGGEFDDPVFGSFKLTFPSAPNAPIIEAKGVDGNANRQKIEFGRASDDSVQATLAVKGNSATIEFANGASLQDDDSNAIRVVEGATLAEDEYYFLNSGDYQRMVQLTKVNVDGDSAADDDITLKDVFTGELIKLEDKNITNITATSWSIDGQTYSVKSTNGTADLITITSSDYTTGIASGDHVYVFPYMETLSGKDTRFALTEDVLALDNFVTGGASAKTVYVELPTGTLEVVSGTVASFDNVTLKDSAGTSLATVAIGSSANVLIGSVYYNVAVADGTGSNATDVTVAVGLGQNNTAAAETNAGFMLVEDKDNSDSDTKNAVIIPTTYTSPYAEVDLSNIAYTGTNVQGVSFDSNDYSGNLDAYGTFLVEDTSDSDQDAAVVTYPSAQMYADLFVAEKDTTITAGTSAGGGTVKELGSVQFIDTQAPASSNLIVVGGSCVNKVAAQLLFGADAAKCGSAWEQKTGVGAGSFLIESFARNGKIATLVAGYNAEDTVNAAKVLRTQTIDTTAGKKYKSTSATAVQLVTA